jgi:hypothetical protein
MDTKLVECDLQPRLVENIVELQRAPEFQQRLQKIKFVVNQQDVSLTR